MEGLRQMRSTPPEPSVVTRIYDLHALDLQDPAKEARLDDPSSLVFLTQPFDDLPQIVTLAVQALLLVSCHHLFQREKIALIPEALVRRPNWHLIPGQELKVMLLSDVLGFDGEVPMSISPGLGPRDRRWNIRIVRRCLGLLH